MREISVRSGHLRKAYPVTEFKSAVQDISSGITYRRYEKYIEELLGQK